MTPKEAKQFLPIIKAYSEGKQIQYLSRDTWEDWEDVYYPEFGSPPEFYRIKPATKTIKIYQRRYVWKHENQYTVQLSTIGVIASYYEGFKNFVCWLDPKDNYIEVEVPV